MKLILQIDPSLIAESQLPASPKMPLDELDTLSQSLGTHMNKEVRVLKDVLDSFQLKDNLNQDIWTKNHLDTEIQQKLIQIALDFYKDLNIPTEAQVKDIIFTGSLANFNWSKYSDIDLHIVLDFDQFDADKKMVEEYFYAQKAMWNQEHDIRIKGFPIEIYVQDLNAKLVATAVYSVLKNKWIKKPMREAFQLDKKTIKDKAELFIYQLRDIRHEYNDKQYKTVVTKIKKLKDKIKQMRNSGLERGGEFSLENLVFKTLRRTPFLDILDSYKAKAYDNLMSVSEMELTEEAPVSLNQPTDNDIKKYMFRGDGFFDFDNAKEFAKKFLGYNLIKQIGTGGNGAAYLTDKRTKLKFTFNENEYYFAKRSIGKKNPHMADYYKALDIADELYIIEMEYLQPLPNGTRNELKKMFDALLNKSDDYNKKLKAKVDNIGQKIGFFANDLFNQDNYGIKNGELATFDPVSEEEMTENGMDDKMRLRKIKKDMETKLGRRVLDSEWNRYLETGVQPKPRTSISIDPSRAAEVQARQAEIEARIARMKLLRR